MAASLFLAALLAAPLCQDVYIEASLAPDLRSVRGSLRCNAEREDADARVATYPRVLRSPHGLTDVSRPWYYPGDFDPADMQLQREGVELPGDGAWQTVGSVKRGEVVRLDFVTKLPERLGSFGRHEGTAYLLGGWHPALGPNLEAARLHYRVRVPAGTTGFVGTTPFGHASARVVSGTMRGVFVPMVIGRAAEIDTSSGDVVLVPRARRHAAGPHDPPWDLADVSGTRDDEARAELVRSLRAGRIFAREEGIAAPPVLVVVAPLRDRMVEPFDGGFAVSDRAFHVLDFPRLADLGLLPEELLLRFHRLAVVRAQARGFALATAYARDEALPAALVAEALATALRDRFFERRYGTRGFAAEFLETFAVIPEIDALIFAPQVSFCDAYFDAVDDAAGVRRRFDDFATRGPSGKLLYERLVDKYGEQAVQGLVRAYVEGTADLLTTAKAVLGDEVAPYLAQWLVEPVHIDYAIGEVQSDLERIRVSVVARGDSAERLREPISVRIVDDDGREHVLRRDGPGMVEVIGKGPPALVEIDPKLRLVQAQTDEGAMPRFDDRTPVRWRFLLNNLNGLFAVTNEQFAGSVNFTLRRIHDLRYRFDFDASYDPQAYGVSTAVSYGFGSAVTPLRLAHRVGAQLSGERLTLKESGGTSLVGALYYHHDTRESVFFAFSGQGVSARLSSSLVGTGAGARPFRQVSLAAFRLFPFGFYHALLVRGRADMTFGNTPKELGLRLGGRYTGGRGYEIDEAVGTRRAILSLEDRHAFVTDGRTDFFGLFTLTRIEGALFADAIYLPTRTAACGRDDFYDVGYGVRFIGDLFNVSPTALALDFGVPLVRCKDAQDRGPVTVYLAFVQSFSVF